MLKLDVVEPCNSPWSSPVLLVPKKDGKLRFCLDSRKLNAITKKDAYKLPYVSEILDNLNNSKFMSSLDLSKAFWQIPIAVEDRDKTAFYVPGRGSFRFKVTPFGLCNSPATQQRLVDSLFCGPEFENSVFVYIDDIVIISSDFNSHISLLMKVYNKLKAANLTINLEKSKFFRTELKYLGYIVNSKGLHVDPAKVQAIVNFPAPTTKKEVKRFLGTASWYRRFIPNFSTIAEPLNRLTATGKGKPKTFVWTTEAENSFAQLKECLSSAPVLACPNFDLEFEVHVDASQVGIAAFLAQRIDGIERPIAYMSKALTPPERNYSITERETLAVLTALEHWRCYIDNGKRFTVYTDHSALKWFLNLNNPTGRLARWGVRLSSFNFDIKHRRGIDNVIPDALSRAPLVLTLNSKLNPTTNTTDKWYLNIYHGCQNSPTSFPNYMVKDGKLYRYMQSKCILLKEFDWKEVIPAETREDILKKNHAEPQAGHLGIFKTYKRLVLHYYWPGMYTDVLKYVSKCDTCLSFKHSTHGTLGKLGSPKKVSRPFHTLSVDYIGPLPCTRKQNAYLLVVLCCFSKYTMLFPLRHANADLVSKILEDNIFMVHGIPNTIILDNASYFTSKTLDLLFKKYCIPNIHYTPRYTPQVNSVERYNQSIIKMLATYIEGDQRSWDVKIPKVQFAMNSSVNETTGFTPNFIVHGRELMPCGSLYVKAEQTNELLFLPRDIYCENLGHLATIFDEVQKSLFLAHQKNTANYNTRRKHFEFNTGDIVFKKSYVQSDKDKYFSKKLAPKYIKCRIASKKSPLVYEIESLSGQKLGVWHIKDLKPIPKYM